MYNGISPDWVYFFVVVGLATCSVVVVAIAIYLYYWLKEKVKNMIKVSRRENMNNCCQKCGAYAPYYKDKYDTKWRSINYCPRCGHDMQDERFYK